MGLDRKTLVAVALCVLFLIFYRSILHFLGWDKYLAPARAPVTAVDTVRRDTSAVSPEAPGPGSSLGSAARPPGGTAAAPSGAAPSGAASSAPGALFQTPRTPPTAELEQAL